MKENKVIDDRNETRSQVTFLQLYIFRRLYESKKCISMILKAKISREKVYYMKFVVKDFSEGNK